MKKMLENIIDSSQNGFIKGRFIGENIGTIYDILDNTNELDIPGIMFFADFEKAFDSLIHAFMLKCLRHFNFGNDLIKWVELFYSDPKKVF